MIARFFIAIGTPLVAFVRYLGEVVLLAADTFRSTFTHRLRWRLFLEQMVEIGLLSQLVVIVTGGFTGAVFAAQTYFQFNKIGMGSATGAVVSVAICRDRANRCPSRARGLSGRLSGRPARSGDDDLDAVARGRVHRLWNYRQLPRGD